MLWNTGYRRSGKGDLNNMKKKIKILTIIIIIISAGGSFLYTEEKKISISIPEFIPLTMDAEMKKIGPGASGLIESALMDNKYIHIRKRGAIKEYLTALEKVQLGLIPPSELTVKSRDLAVDLMILGSAALYNEQYEIDSRIVDPGSWIIFHAAGSASDSLDSSCVSIDKSFQVYFNNRGKDYSAQNLPASWERDIPVSVFRFRDSNKKSKARGYGEAISEMLNTELAALNKIPVIERLQSAPLLKEKSLEMLGVIENDSSDQYFGIKGITYKISGSINAFEELVCISYKIYNVDKKMTDFFGYREIGSAEALRPAVRDMAGEIADMLLYRMGSVKITSRVINRWEGGTEVAGMRGTVYIDGVPAGRTPVTISLSAGRHTVQIKGRVEGTEYDSGYFGYVSSPAEKEFTVSPGRQNTIEINLLSDGYMSYRPVYKIAGGNTR